MRTINNDAVPLTDGDWHDEAIPDGARAFILYTTKDLYVAWTSKVTDPTYGGARLEAGKAHSFDCRGAKYMHYRRVPAESTSVEITYLIGS